MAYKPLTSTSRSSGYQPLTGGSAAPAMLPTGPPPPEDKSLLGFVGNFLEGGVNLFKGLGSLVVSGVSDVGKLAADAAAMGQFDFDYSTPEIAAGLTGIDALNAGKPTPSAIVEDFKHRYGPLAPGGPPASEFMDRVYEDPFSFGLDALALGAGAGKAAQLAARSPGVRAGLDALAVEKLTGAPADVGGLVRAVNAALPETRPRLVGNEVVPMTEPWNPVTRAITRPIERRITEDVGDLEARAGALKAIVDSGHALPSQIGEYNALKHTVELARAGGVTRVDKPFVSTLRLRRATDRLLGQHFSHGQHLRDTAIREFAEAIRPVVDEGLEDELVAAAQGLSVDPSTAVHPGFLPETKVLDEAGVPVRVYHGTSATYATPDITKGDPHAMHGRGHNFTEDPEIAGGRVERFYERGGQPSEGYAFTTLERTRPRPTDLDQPTRAEIASRIRESIHSRGSGYITQSEWTYLNRALDDYLVRSPAATWGGIAHLADQPYNVPLREILDELAPATGEPQVRPAYLDIRNPFDLDAPAGDDLWDSVEMALFGDVKRVVDEAGQGKGVKPIPQLTVRQEIAEKYRIEPGARGRRFWDRAVQDAIEYRLRSGEGAAGETVATALSEFLGSPEKVNRFLEDELGFDGLTHIGGTFTGSDPHRVWIAFHDDQVKPFREATEFGPDVPNRAESAEPEGATIPEVTEHPSGLTIADLGNGIVRIRGYHGTLRGRDPLALSREELGFGGFHFGTRAAAEDRATSNFLQDAEIIPVEVEGRFLGLESPLSETDKLVFEAGSIDEAIGVDLLPEDVLPFIDPGIKAMDEAAKAAGKNIRDFAEDQGWDGVIYRNEGEGLGDPTEDRSVMIWDGSNARRLDQSGMPSPTTSSSSSLTASKSKSISSDVAEVGIQAVPSQRSTGAKLPSVARSTAPLSFQYRTAPVTSPTPFQPHSTPDEVLAAAVPAEQELRAILTEAFGEEAIDKIRIKTPEATADKIARKHAEGRTDYTAASVLDAVASRVKVANWSEVFPSLERLREYGDIVEVNDLMRDPKVGFRAMGAKVRMPSGFIAEVQFHTELGVRVARATHPLYESARAMKREIDDLRRSGEEIDPVRMREYEITKRLAQRAHEPVLREMEAHLSGREISTVEQTMENLRLLVQERWVNPMIERGMLTPAQAFERAYLPLRVQTGARFDYAEGAFEGGMDALVIDRMLDEAGQAMPIYFPHVDIRRTNFSDFLVTSKRTIGARASAEPGFAKRSTGYLIEKGLYETDPTAAYARRAAQAVRTDEVYALVRDVTERFGRPITEKDQFDPATERLYAPDGLLRFFRTKLSLDDEINDLVAQARTYDEALAEALRHTLEPIQDELGDVVTRSGVGVTGRGLQLYAIPKAVAERLEAHARSMLAPSLERNVRLFWDTPTNAWRGVVLAGSPRWVVNNTLGNTGFLKMQGARLSDVIRQLDKRYREKLDAIPGMREARGGMFTEAEQYVRHRGTASLTPTGQALEAAGNLLPVRVLKGIGARMRRLNAIVEDAFRQASYLKALERQQLRKRILEGGRAFDRSLSRLERIAAEGATPAQIRGGLDEVNYFFNDYMTQTPFAKQHLRRFVAPFWSFYRHVAKLAVRFPIDYPLRAEVLRGLTLVTEEIQAEIGPVPEWLEGALPMGQNPDGTTRFFTTRGANPFSMLTQTPMSLLHPAWKIVYERSSGRSAFTGRQFTDPDVVTPFGSDQQFELSRDEQGRPIFAEPVERVTPGLIEHLFQQLPQYELAKDVLGGGAAYSTASLPEVLFGRGVIREPSGEPLYPYSTLEELAGFAGMPTIDFDVADYQRELAEDQQRALAEAIRRLSG